ncbi:unnamed protein product [Candidatus Protochlamydia amoebophila UWE25]|uniref:Uncharacterized protein n=1 Tax=Protochlamydia amoebophila (strain UWE25) TaxID=264201 RepID=Q6MFB9_PARUW|nr:unnamed protein product [Candidatus Protochlamydia amoebophila UWE25]
MYENLYFKLFSSVFLRIFYSPPMAQSYQNAFNHSHLAKSINTWLPFYLLFLIYMKIQNGSAKIHLLKHFQ